jgi:oxygen-independent coproporphyrinogen III oxidase
LPEADIMEIVTESAIAATLGALDTNQHHGDYIYMYPPRQAYRKFVPSEREKLAGWITSSLAHSDLLNVYLHVPFCKQICSFCNLYTTRADGNTDLHDYAELLRREASMCARRMDRKTLQTIYLGGGTPSLLDPRDVGSIIECVTALFGAPGSPSPKEVAIEVAPETVDATKLRALRSAGINRINLGMQSTVPQEVAHLGRRRHASHTYQLVEEALDMGFSNVCVDLIYGLEYQTDESWERSLRDVIRLSPPTVCAYALTSRPYTGYQRRGFGGVEPGALHRRYEVADQLLTEAGYTQETHVRWVKSGGGYLQKEYHWGMQNLLGLGAGARSYLWYVDTRNGYSIGSRGAALEDYARAISDDALGIVDGFAMSEDERIRKAIVLGLIDLDRQWFRALFGCDPVETFPNEFGTLERLELCTIRPERIKLTRRGRKYRDTIVQLFFSRAVRARLDSFLYRE